MMPVETICASLMGVRAASVMQIRELEPLEVILTAYRDVALLADRCFPPVALTVAFEAALAGHPCERRMQVRAACAELAVLANTCGDAELATFYDCIKRTLERDCIV